MKSVLENRDRMARGCATAALVLFAYALVALAVLHVLRPDYAPATNFVSNYAVGAHGWIMTTFFVAFSLGLLALSASLYSSGARTAHIAAGLAALTVTAAGLIVTAIYPTDLPGAAYTRSGDIHELAFRINVVGILVGVLVISAAVGAQPVWRRYRRTLWALAGLVVAALVIQFATLRKGLPFGLANRFFVVTVFAWMMFVAHRIRTRISSPIDQVPLNRTL
jgi:hypothetical membrane protein